MKVVGLGGGHGLARALSALRLLGESPTAVVTVADDGGSSGRLREAHGVVALGDLRMALFTLAENSDLAPVLQHRFSAGDVKDHALGNLLLLALIEMYDGDLVRALDHAGTLLACAGRVLPTTTSAVQLRAQVGDEEVGGQVQVATAKGPMRGVWLEPARPEACAEAVAAIGGADAVVLGPGSLFTSLIATLLVPGVAAAVTGGPARVIAVANLLTQPGETSDFDIAGHVDALVAHVPGLQIDTLVLHAGPQVHGAGRPIGRLDSHPAVGCVVGADLAQRDPDGTVTGIHDPHRLAAALEPLLG